MKEDNMETKSKLRELVKEIEELKNSSFVNQLILLEENFNKEILISNKFSVERVVVHKDNKEIEISIKERKTITIATFYLKYKEITIHIKLKWGKGSFKIGVYFGKAPDKSSSIGSEDIEDNNTITPFKPMSPNITPDKYNELLKAMGLKREEEYLCKKDEINIKLFEDLIKVAEKVKDFKNNSSQSKDKQTLSVERVTLDSLIEQYVELLKERTDETKIGFHCNFSNYNDLKNVSNKWTEIVKKDRLEANDEDYLRNTIWGTGNNRLINSVANKIRLTSCMVNNNSDNLLRLAKAIDSKIDKLSKNEELNFQKDIIKGIFGLSSIVNNQNQNILKNEIDAFVRELFYVINIEEDNYPLWNGCTKDAVANIRKIEGYEKKVTDFEIIRTITDKLKDKLPNSNGYPYYYLIDKFFNLFDKIKEKDINTETDKVKRFYEDAYKYIKQSSNTKQTQDTKDNNNKMEKQPLNQILYGPPGTGKTYNTINKALEIINKKEESNVDNNVDNDERLNLLEEFNKYAKIDDKKKNLFSKSEEVEVNQIEFVTFHQNYTYEDFVIGIKPNIDSDKLTFKQNHGIFYKICKKAYDDQNNNYVLIIDEINRANISRVFGELITLLEDDKRIGAEHELIITLPNGESFGVPKNLYIIGTMNTADKSIALIDIALRRRFHFEAKYPDYDLVEDDEKKTFLEKINKEIFKEKKSADWLIGHAYFMKNESLEVIVINKVIPLLMEYFNNNTETVQKILDNKYTYNSHNDFKWENNQNQDEEKQ